MNVYVTRSNEQLFLNCQVVNKDLVYHTKQCEIFNLHMSEMRLKTPSDFQFKEIERKFKLCSYCSQLGSFNSVAHQRAYEEEKALKEKGRRIMDELSAEEGWPL